MTEADRDAESAMMHLHRCHFHGMAPEERCPQMFECADDCVEDEQETIGFCTHHEALAQELEKILNG